ncbi:unnamed protein product [Mytilus coruscus]|uniref:Ig-like domain-containing protein n=1 Tax=Mytilus coruscus TaxID=42192 RepID=A0A6J8B405_MYTCO|nr:unnamed protein product [Mytilus coruscus]
METFLEVRGQVDQIMNGKWSCHYGRNLEIAYVDVKIIKEKVLIFFLHWYKAIENYRKGIRISGAKLTKTGGQMWLTCYSNIALAVKLVTFYVNNDLYNTINKDINGCRSSVDNGVCDPDQCHCSEDGTTYFMKHTGLDKAGNVSIQCKMEFEFGLEMTDCIIVNVIDLDKPVVAQDKDQPLFASDYVTTICSALVKGTVFQLEWDCFHFKPISTIRNETHIKSILSFQVTSSMNNKICTCKASYKNLQSSTSLKIEVSKAPVLTLNNMFVCNQSTTITIVCNATSELPVKQFGLWVHLYKNDFIRFLNGTQNSSTSTIELDKCNLEDGGEYVCQAHSREKGNMFWSNASTIVAIKGPPYVGTADIFEEPVLTVSVKLYSAPPPLYIEWFLGKHQVQNSTRFAQMLVTTSIQKQMHGKEIATAGYKAILKMQNFSRDDITTISISVQNEFGNVTKIFEINRSSNQRTGQRVDVRSIYFAAFPQESNANRYAITEQVSQYVEIGSIQNEELNVGQENAYEEADKEEEDRHSDDGYQMPHDYVEVF